MPFQTQLFGKAHELIVKAIRELYDLTEKLRKQAGTGLSVIQDTHGNRFLYPAVDQELGTFFFETDRAVYYQVRVVKGRHEWAYSHGKMRIAALATAGAVPTDLSNLDVGFLLYAADYDHTWRWWGDGAGWGGGGWHFEDGEEQPGQFGLWAVAPSRGWKAIDGTGDDGQPIGASHPIRYALPSTAVGSWTSFDSMLGGVYPKGKNAFSGSVVAATGGGLTGATANESSHTHAIDHDHPAVTSGDNNLSHGFPAGTIGTVTVAEHTHTHQVDVAALSQASGAGSAHSHGGGTLAVDATAEPAHMEFLPFVRK